MCESGGCENTCSPETAAKCPLLSIIDKINQNRESVSEQVTVTIIQDKPNIILRGKAGGNSASHFFRNGWTAGR